MAKKEHRSSLRVSGYSNGRMIPKDLSESLGKVPPSATDLEETLLGAIMIEQNAIEKVEHLLKPEHFYQEKHKEIYQAILDLRTEQLPVDMRYVVKQLRKAGKIELIGGAFYLGDLTSKVSSAANIQHDALIILEMSLKRQLIMLASKIHHDAYEDTTDVHELLEKTEQDFEFLKKNSIPKNDESYIKSLWELYQVKDEPHEESPLITIDGTPIAIPGNHTLIVGKKKSRKTLFMIWLVAQFIKAGNDNANGVLFFDTEQGRAHVYQIRLKIYKMTGIWIPIFTLRGKSPEERKEFIELTVKHWKHKSKMLVIDGIRDLMSNINDADESTELIVWLEKLTTEYNVGILEVLHLNKTDNNARGHIGTELLNKAVCTIEMELDEKNGCTQVKCESARDKSFETFAFTHDADALPSIVGVPIKGEIMPQEEKRERLEMVFDGDVTLSHDEVVKRCQVEFEVGQTKAKQMVSRMIRNKNIMRFGKAHAPGTVYKLGSVPIDENGHSTSNGTATVQISLGLEQKIRTQEQKVEEKVSEEEDVPLPF